MRAAGNMNNAQTVPSIATSRKCGGRCAVMRYGAADAADPPILVLRHMEEASCEGKKHHAG